MTDNRMNLWRILQMTDNRMNCSLWYWLRQPLRFNELIKYCNAFGWDYFWIDSCKPFNQLIGSIRKD